MTRVSVAAPSAQLTAFSPKVRIRRGVSVAFMVAALLAIAISMIMLGALIVEIAVDGAARLFTDGAPVGREARGGGILTDLPTPAGMGWMTWALPVAILLPFIGPRLIHALVPGLPQIAERAIGSIVVAPAADLRPHPLRPLRVGLLRRVRQSRRYRRRQRQHLPGPRRSLRFPDRPPAPRRHPWSLSPSSRPAGSGPTACADPA